MPSGWFWALSVVVVVSAALWAWKRRRDSRLRARKSAEARAWAARRIADLESRDLQPLPAPDINTDPEIAALRERFIQSIDDGDENPSFWGQDR